MTAVLDGSTGDSVARLLQGYRPADGVPDELIGPDGAVRPVWDSFIRALAAQTPEKMAARIGQGEQYLRDAGVYFRRYGPQDTGQRDWPLSHVPVLISETEWDEIALGLTERAGLLEQVVADIYSDNRLVAEGHLPASLVANNPEWLRPLVGVKPASGHFLHFMAFDIGRGPTGDWWVLSDRTQAPSGAGFALENRMATARVYSDMIARTNVAPLAGFFREFRDRLTALSGSDNSQVGILTPGPLNETYFEHAFIARHLGFPLLQGDDLTVQNGRTMIRTVNGTSPVSVLWRRMDAGWVDPLELNEGSRLGTPGLLRAIRAGHLTMVNALGSGILETRALMAFMPRLSQILNGCDLRLPNIATWWCGQESESAYMRDHPDGMMISPAFATAPVFEAAQSNLSVEEIAARIQQNGPDLVGQEQVHLSTAPTLIDGALVPRPMSLRVFLARTASGWKVMPGGFAQIGMVPDSNILAMQQGGRVADVWIVGDSRAKPKPILPSKPAAVQRSAPGRLPSRAADNLYWLGRYVERGEHIVRILRAHHARLSDTEGPLAPVVQCSTDYLASFGCDSAQPIPDGLLSLIDNARACASQVGDRFSVDGALALSDLTRSLHQQAETALPGDSAALAMSVLLRNLNGFSGLVHENMYRFTGWRFLAMGRAAERAATMCGCLAAFADPESPTGGLDLVMEVGDSVMTHHRRYAMAPCRETVVDLMALDELNPRGVLFQFNQMETHLRHLPGVELHHQMTPLSRAVLKARTDLALQTPETLSTEVFNTVLAGLGDISNQTTLAYLT
ncbi:circularly permuted type 2 ATP-grasp protein [Fluviibacterium sp. DFM31]|uniref:Circularly permuted type 2 ATP-grasp protein n=1 Tax=Meridianimarinicoccus marinus TaxID=3231483 RepID=A0ABV3L883_9RHOB